MRTIYIDILLCVNLIISFLLLCAASFYTHEVVTVKRLLLGSAVGAASSLTILLPEMPLLISLLIKAATGAATVFSAFGRRSLRAWLKLYAVFLAVTFFFGGVITALWFFFTPKDMLLRGGVVYLNIPPLTLIAFSMLCYGAFRLFFTVSGKYKSQTTLCSLTLCSGQSSVCVTAKIDTGNSLCEPFSQCPVIVIGRETAKDITPMALKEYETVTALHYRTEVGGVRFVPFSSVGGKGILPCFKAEEVFINGNACRKSVYIALCDDELISGEYRALVPFEIL